MSDLRERADEILDDLEEIEFINIHDDPVNSEIIEVIVRGRLKKNLGSGRKRSDDYDRAMKGLDV